MIIKCAFTVDEINDDLAYLLKEDIQLAKLYLLYKRRWLTGDHVIRTLVRWAQEDKTPITSKTVMLNNITYLTFPSLMRTSETRKALFDWWDYLNPNIRKGLTLEFAKGSKIKRLTLR